MRALLALALVVGAACAGGTARSSSGTPAASASVAATPTGQIDVTDMMGLFPPATFFVVRPGREISAVALLNHATKYTIPIEGETQVATWPEAGRLYVLDGREAGARLRSFDIASGAEQASRPVPNAKPAPTGIGHGKGAQHVCIEEGESDRGKGQPHAQREHRRGGECPIADEGA